MIISDQDPVLDSTPEQLIRSILFCGDIPCANDQTLNWNQPLHVSHVVSVPLRFHGMVKM